MSTSIHKLNSLKSNKESYLHELEQQKSMLENQYIANASRIQFDQSPAFEINESSEIESSLIQLDLETCRTRHEIEAIETDIKSLELSEVLQKQQ